MAQPSGRICGASIRYRVYLCSSPLFCFADGLSILIRLVVASIYLRISPLKASRLAIVSRADERHHSKRNDGTSFDDSFLPTANEVTPPSNTATWPRWLFFLLATVPAVIQLASFKGLPITQTFGLMFVSSFIIIELVTFFSNFEERRSIPEVLSYVKLEEVPTEEQEIRSKVFRMTKGLEWTETCLFMMTFIVQLAVMSKLIHDIRIPAPIFLCKAFEYTSIQVICSTLGVWVISTTIASAIRFMLWLCGVRPSLNHWFLWRRWYSIWIYSNMVFPLIPYQPQSSSESSGFLKMQLRVVFLFYIASISMPRLCERFPSIAKALLIDRRP